VIKLGDIFGGISKPDGNISVIVWTSFTRAFEILNPIVISPYEFAPGGLIETVTFTTLVFDVIEYAVESLWVGSLSVHSSIW